MMTSRKRAWVSTSRPAKLLLTALIGESDRIATPLYCLLGDCKAFVAQSPKCLRREFNALQFLQEQYVRLMLFEPVCDLLHSCLSGIDVPACDLNHSNTPPTLTSISKFSGKICGMNRFRQKIEVISLFARFCSKSTVAACPENSRILPPGCARGRYAKG